MDETSPNTKASRSITFGYFYSVRRIEGNTFSLHYAIQCQQCGYQDSAILEFRSGKPERVESFRKLKKLFTNHRNDEHKGKSIRWVNDFNLS